jgi:hypothetical protein
MAVSKVVTVNEQVAVVPMSVAVQVTVVTPTGKQEPDGGVQATRQLFEVKGGG